MAFTRAARREEQVVGKYRVTILFDVDGKPLGAIVEGPRLRKPIYIAAMERVAPHIPKNVIKLLKKYGFMVEEKE